MNRLRTSVYWGLGFALCVVVSGVILLALTGLQPHTQARLQTAQDAKGETGQSDDEGATVHTIHPKCDPSFTLSVKGPAEAKAYEWADLEAQVAGRVEFIRKAEGSEVTAGELLIKLAVPDLDVKVLEKESVVHQREAELRLAEANEKTVRAGIRVADKTIEVQKAAVDMALATRDYRENLLKRLEGLVEDKAATRQVVEEYKRDFHAAVADVTKAQASVLKAKADLEEIQAKLEAAQADVQLKRELISVAQKDREWAEAMADYARIKAPFDGVVTRRNVNRGSFVQNATTGQSEPLLRVERRDIVTVTMKVPDTFASYVNNDTEAVLDMNELPGQSIHGKVTRFSPTLDNKTNDHTMCVQVDLYNGTESEYRAFLLREKSRKVPFDDLKEGALPLAPRITGPNAVAFHMLYPGMYGEMRLVFRQLENVFLIPSDAIVRQGGTPYLYLVENGKAKVQPIEVQVDDQKLAKVSLLQKTAKGTVKRELTGREEVIYSNQGELMEGETVKPIPQDWTP